MAREVDRLVVSVRPDTTGFGQTLRTQLKKATAGIEAKVRVKADDTVKGIAYTRGSIRKVLREASKGLSVAVKVEAKGAKQLAKDVDNAAKSTKKLGDEERKRALMVLAAERHMDAALGRRAAKMQKAIEDEHRLGQVQGRARREMEADFNRRATEFTRAIDQENRLAKAEAARQAKAIADERRMSVVRTQARRQMDADFTRRGAEFVRSMGQERQLAAMQAQARRQMDADFTRRGMIHMRAIAEAERVAAAQARQAARAAAAQEREAVKAANAQIREAKRVERETNAARTRMKKAFTPPQLIDFGGQGIKPMNLLIAGLLALIPPLVAMGASAFQASTALAALGSAGIGAVAGIAAVGFAVTGVLSTFKAYQAAQKSARGEAANSGTAAASAARQVRNAEESYADALAASRRAQDDLNRSRRDALRDLRELRETVSDLALDERDAQLSLIRAQQEAAKVNKDAKSTLLDRQEANLAVLRAEDRYGDIQRERRERQAELNKVTREGVDSTDRVKASLEGVAAAQRQVVNARRGIDEAKQAAATQRVSSATTEYAEQLGKLSKPARELVRRLIAAEPRFEAFRRKVERAVLPGFISFLDDINVRTKRIPSTIDVVTDSVITMGRSVSRTTALLGKALRSPWFKRDLAIVNAANTKSFDLLGRASVTFLRPLMRIIAAAAPQFTRFSGYVLELAQRFDRWIGDLDKGELERWFVNAGDALAKWWRIATNVLGILKGLFTASLPTGTSLVERLGEFTQRINEAANSRSGQESIKRFFEFFQRIDYVQLGKTIAQLTALFLALRLVIFAVNNGPMGLLITFLGMLATKYPDGATKVIEGLAASIGAVVDVYNRNQDAFLRITALVVALAALNKLRGLKLPSLLGGGKGGALDTFFKGGKTASMTVTAGVVHVNGPVGGVGKGGVPPIVPVPPGGAAPGKGGRFSRLSGIARGAGILAVIPLVFDALDIVDSLLPKMAQGYLNGQKLVAAQGDLMATVLQKFGLARNADLLRQFSKDKSWSDAFWSFFDGQTWKTIGDAWTFAGEDLSKNIFGGLMDGLSTSILSFPAWLQREVVQPIIDAFNRLFGIRSPSTVFMAMGADLIAGLYLGIARKVTAILPSLSTLATMMVRALTNPFAMLSGLLATPIHRAMTFLDAYLITPINKVLKALDIKPLPLIVASGGTGRNKVTGAIANVNNTKAPVGNRQGLASGGMIAGRSPHKRADNIPVMATAKEFVMPVDSVEHYGPGFMEAVRARKLPRFANGGQVRPSGSGMLWPSMWNWVKQRFPGASLSSSYRPGDPGYHGSGRAVDIVAPGVTNGTGMARQIFSSIKRSFFKNIAELIWDFAGNKAVWNGREHFFTGPGAGPGTHDDHIHWALARGGLAPGGSALGPIASRLAVPDYARKQFDRITKKALAAARGVFPGGVAGDLLLGGAKRLAAGIPGYADARISMFDQGGMLQPGVTLAVNRTGRPERVLSPSQDRNGLRIDRRDLQALANLIAAATARPIEMDGRRVGEAVAEYQYVPMGV